MFRKRWKRIIVIFALLLLIAIAYISYAGLYRIEHGDFVYLWDCGNVSVIDYIGNDTEVTLPNRLYLWPIRCVGGRDYYTSKWGSFAFKGCSDVIDLTIPEGVEEISYAFYGLDTSFKLRTLNLPKSLKRMDWTFYHCSELEIVEGGENVKRVVNSFHLSNKWKEKSAEEFLVFGDGVLIEYRGDDQVVTIPDGVKYISPRAFTAKGLSKAVLPKSLLEVGSEAFVNCKNLEVIEGGDNIRYASHDSFINTKWINERSEEFVIIGDGVLIDCHTTEAEVRIPNEVKVCADYCLDGIRHTGFTAIILPESVEEFADFCDVGKTVVIKGDKTYPNDDYTRKQDVFYTKTWSESARYARKHGMERHHISEYDKR